VTPEQLLPSLDPQADITGIAPFGQVTFRGLHDLGATLFPELAARYPKSVQRTVDDILRVTIPKFPPAAH